MLEQYEDSLEEGELYTKDDFNECRLAYGASVLAVADGEIIAVTDGMPENFPIPTEGGGGGNAIVLQHAGGTVSFYAHMIPLTLTNATGVSYQVGDTVKQGDQLGLLGNSGHSTGPRLHFHLSESYYAPAGWGEGVPVYFNNVYVKTGLHSL